MSTLSISFPEVWNSALYVSAGTAVDPDYPIYNLIGGKRHNYFRFSSAAASGYVRADLGSAATKTCDHMCIARADLLKAYGVTSMTLERGSDGAAWTTQATIGSFGSLSLFGPRGHDYITTFTTSSAFRWWKVGFAAPSSKFQCSSIYFGNLFDMGVDPESCEFQLLRPRTASFIADSGAEFVAQLETPVYQFEVSWFPVTDEKAEEFANNISRYRKRTPVFLYAPVETQLLDGKTLFHVTLDEATRETVVYNRNRITATFTEVLG